MLYVGFVANASLDPVMVVTGITPTRYSHHMVKESRCFVINFPKKSYQKEYNYLGSASGRDKDKFQDSVGKCRLCRCSNSYRLSCKHRMQRC